MDAITIKNLDVVFGDKPKQALELLDQGKTRQEIIDETGQVVGVDNVSLTVEGEICVLMGLSGSGNHLCFAQLTAWMRSAVRSSWRSKDGTNWLI